MPDCWLEVNNRKILRPATSTQGFLGFACAYKQMLRWFPRFQVATTCFVCSPPDLNLLVTNFIFCIHVKKKTLQRVTTQLKLINVIIIIIIIIIINLYSTSHSSWAAAAVQNCLPVHKLDIFISLNLGPGSWTLGKQSEGDVCRASCVRATRSNIGHSKESIRKDSTAERYSRQYSSYPSHDHLSSHNTLRRHIVTCGLPASAVFFHIIS